MTERKTIISQIAELEHISMSELKEKYRFYFNSEPPPFNRQFLVKKLAYHIQEKAYGGISRKIKRNMDEILKDAGFDKYGIPEKVIKKKKVDTEQNIDISIPGTRLVRFWKDEKHEVFILKDGFEYNSKKYRSLSAIAREITGTQWNGLLFFKVRSVKKKKTQVN